MRRQLCARIVPEKWMAAVIVQQHIIIVVVVLIYSILSVAWYKLPICSNACVPCLFGPSTVHKSGDTCLYEYSMARSKAQKCMRTLFLGAKREILHVLYHTVLLYYFDTTIIV